MKKLGLIITVALGAAGCGTVNNYLAAKTRAIAFIRHDSYFPSPPVGTFMTISCGNGFTFSHL